MYANPDLSALIQLAGGASGRHSSPPGFYWGDAGIGAAGATVLLGARAGGVGMTRFRRTQRKVVG